jgi:hypothetical protein
MSSPRLSENKAVLHLSPRHRSWISRIIIVSALSPLSAQHSSDAGWHDPEFDNVPFTSWFSGAPQTPLKWTDHVLPVVLSVHQRLLARVQVQLDGAEAAKRRGEGEMIFFFQLTDARGQVYQDHSNYDLEKAEEGLRAQDLSVTESAFVLPGDYTISLAIYDTATKEHAVRRDKLHVAPLKTEPLPNAWRDLPPVEFIEPSEPPDRWFLPKELGRLYLPLTLRRPLKVEIIANLTPSELNARPYGVQDRNLGFLIPALKVISQMTAPTLSMSTSLLDLSRRRVVFHQEDAHEPDWEKMKSSLSDATSGKIDVKSLADRQHNAAFFLKEVARGCASEEPLAARAVIVLSGPMIFDADQDLQGVELRGSPNARVFYIRLQSADPARPIFAPDQRRRRTFGGYPGRPPVPPGVEPAVAPQADQLEPMLRPLDPRLFDVSNAEQFRKALGTIMNEISNL